MLLSHPIKQILVLTFCLCSTFAFSQNFAYRYNVKFVCGKSNGEVVGRGIYHTAINILNPNKDSIVAQSIISVALPRMPGMVTGGSKFSLRTNQSLEIDCPEIMERTRSVNSFRKGFVIINSSAPLEIVAVYTATGKDGMVESIHTERVSFQEKLRSEQCPDLVIDSIGKAESNGQQTKIRIKVKNIGTQATGMPSQVSLTDPSHPDGSGTPYQAFATIPNLGYTDYDNAAIVTFLLPYVYHPGAVLKFLADNLDQISECNESNNSETFHSP